MLELLGSDMVKDIGAVACTATAATAARIAVICRERGMRFLLDRNRFRVLVLLMMGLCVDLFVFFEILRTLECLLAHFALVRLERSMYCRAVSTRWQFSVAELTSNMASNMISLCTRRSTVLPVARQAEIIRRLAADMIRA